MILLECQCQDRNPGSAVYVVSVSTEASSRGADSIHANGLGAWIVAGLHDSSSIGEISSCIVVIRALYLASRKLPFCVL